VVAVEDEEFKEEDQQQGKEEEVKAEEQGTRSSMVKRAERGA